jgi:hypothetical protein
MAIALVTNVAKNGSGASAAIDTTGADFLVAIAGGLANVIAPTDSKSNTWTEIRDEVGDFSGDMAIYYVANPTVGSGHTFTPTGSFNSICIAAFSGLSSSPLDQQNGRTASTGDYTAGSITPSQSDCLIIAGIGGSNGTSHNIGSGFTITNQNDSLTSVTYDSALAYLIQTSAGAVNPAWTLDTFASEGVVLVSFKPTGGGGGATWPGYQSPFGWRRNKTVGWRKSLGGLLIPPQVSLA